ncbi:MAG: 4Fe-4S binding protein [Polyangiaceae bacterium]
MHRLRPKRCPTDAISVERKLLHVIDPELCIDCGACGIVCPDEAIYDHEGNLCDMLKPAARPRAYVDLQSIRRLRVVRLGLSLRRARKWSLSRAAITSPSQVITKKCVGCTLCEPTALRRHPHLPRRLHAGLPPRTERNAKFEEIGARTPAAAEGSA